MPYTEAFILEVQRLSSVLPICPPRMVTSEIKIGGYNLYKGHSIYIYIYDSKILALFSFGTFNFSWLLLAEIEFTPSTWLTLFWEKIHLTKFCVKQVKWYQFLQNEGKIHVSEGIFVVYVLSEEWESFENSC